MKKSTASLHKLVKILSDQQFHDGDSLGNQLGMTRTAIWKIIKKLKEYGLPIESVKGKGYLLSEPYLLLDNKKIKALLKNKPSSLEIFESISSTSDHLRTNAQKNKINVCLAETQTQGKGRLGRHWHSPFGKNLYCSISYPFSVDISELSGLSLVVGLSICKTLEEICETSELLSVKWPNDIYYQNKKIGGSLIEVQAETHGQCQAIIGIGINVNMINTPSRVIDQPWTSLQQVMNTQQDRNELSAKLLDTLFQYLQQFSEKSFSSFAKEWASRDYLVGKKISLKSSEKNFAGKALGVDERGLLLLDIRNDLIIPFSAGDTSILKA